MRNKALLLSWVLLFIAIALFSVVTAESVVCEIVGRSAYATLQEALDDINTGDTVKLRNNIEHRDTIEVNGKTINFDLNGYTLDVTVTTGDAIVVGSGGIITIDDTAGGELNASGGIRGVYAHDGGEATVTNAIRLNNPGYFGEENCAAYAENYGEIIVKNDATGQSSSSYGAYAYNRGTITVEGNCTGVYVGAQADGYGSVIVEGNSTGAFRGSWATNHGTIEVQGDSVGTATGNSAGAEAEGDSEITIYGDAIGLTYGVIADRSSITVHGDCSATETYTGIGVDASSSPTNVTVKGNVYGRDYGVHSTDGPQIRVEGNVQSDSCAVLGYYGRIDILGNVISGNIGIDLYAGNIYVEETVSAPKYIILATVEKNASDGVIDGRYYKYSDSFANAYIRIPPVINSVSSDKSFIISAGGDLNVSVSGINMPEDVIVAAFNGDIKVTEASAEGDDLSKTAILMFPPAEDDIDILCTIKASMDGGLTWAEAIDSVILRHAPVLVTNITVSSESDVTTLFTGNPLQLTAVVTPSDADYTDVTWNVIPGTGDASITSTGLLTGTSEGTVTVEATATDDSEIKGTIEITFLTKPVMSGTINISGAAKYNEVLSVDVSGITYTPDTSDDVCTIQWKRNGTNISGATGNTYRLVQADIGCVITVTVSADGVNATGSVSSEPTSVVEKQDGPPAPAKPVLDYKTYNSVHLVEETGLIYQREGDSSWYAFGDFTGLNANTTYTFRAKIPATATRKESPVSEPLSVTTDPMPSHNVTYYPNDGEETPAITDSVQEGMTFQLIGADSFDPPSDMKFKEWNDEADGTGNSYAAGATLTMQTSDMEFYAIWERKTYPVTYYSNGGTGTAPTETDKLSGQTFVAVANSFTAPVEKKFKEWNTMADGSGDSYLPGDIVTVAYEKVDLYAIWEVIKYPVTYHANGGSGEAPVEIDRAKDEVFTTAAADSFIAPVEKRFKQWNTKADGTGIGYGAGVNVSMPSGGLELYAIWEDITYTATYHKNDGTGETFSGPAIAFGQSFSALGAGTFAAPAEMRFVEWNTQADGNGVGYTAGENIIMPSGGIDLYAVWEVITYSVTYHSNYGSENTFSEDGIPVGEIFEVVECTFDPPYMKRFKEWNTNPYGEGDTYNAGDSILMPSGGLDLYAIWELATYKVIYDGNGSTGGSEPIDSNEYTFGTYATILSYGTLSKAGYKFIGWNTEADGTGTLYQAGYNYYMEAEDITFYAQWEPYIEDDFTDPNFKQAVWEWLGNPVGSTPGNFTKQDLIDGMGPFKDLYLSYRGITSLAGLEHFSDTGLKYLVVNDNQLTVIPELPGTLKSLSCYNNQLICLPELPDTIEDLYCYNNQLTSLPELPDSLESLYCYSNLLTSLPELPESLENLLCQENQLTTLPQLPAGLKTLSCGNNELEYLPELPEGIESITCWVNKLESLPDLPDSLKSLQCSYNRITSLPSIPESMESLYCTNNLLTDLPEIPEGLFLSASENLMDVTKEPLKSILDNYDGTKYVTPQLRYLSYVSGIELETGSNYSIASRIYKRSLYDSISYSDSVATNLSDFAFVSSDENVATVNEAGIITAVGNGNCTITALFKDYDSEFTKVEFQVNAYTFYSITYYSNGGTGDPPAAVQVRGGTNFEPAANSMTPPEAMRLKEWNTAADGSGDSYIPGITYTMPNRNLSLYAIWEVIPTYTVTYDGNGSVTGAVPTDSNIYYEGDYAVIADSGDLAKPGYKFGGWSDSPDGSGWLYQAGESLRIDEENVILYAQWSLVITNDFTDINFRQAVWEWLGNPVGSTPGDFSELDLKLRAEEGAYLDVSAREIESLAGFEHFRDTYLYALICNDNKLTELPELPDFLQGLSCSENQLKSLPDLPEYLQILICGDNTITSLPNLPEYMFYMVCDNNLLCELPQLPEDMMLLSFAGNYIQVVNRLDIETIIENGGLVTAYPQQKFGGHEEDIKLKEGENFSIADKFYTQSYDGTAWSEIVPFTDISLLNFSSSDNSIVTVSDTGVMTGVRKGKCQITVLLGNNDSPYTKVVFDVEVTRRATAGDTGNTSVPPAPATDIMEIIRTESKDNGLVVANISVTSPKGANSVEFTLPKTVTKQLTESNIDILTINTQIANFSISKAELAAISGESDGDINISASIVDLQTLSEETRAVIGDRPVYSFKIRVGDRTISQFTDAITLSVPYAISEGEDPEAIVIYYINAQGQFELITDCLYDEQTGMVTFSTDHFSKFAVGYNKITFDDVDENAWYSKAVAFAAARGITQGIGNNCFGPEVKLTRGQFIVMLMKAYGIEPDIDPSDNFADAGNTFYTGYLAAAKRLGISAGIGNNMYGPENEITRQEMVTLAYNTLKLLGKFPAVPIDALPGDFTDKDRVAIWAREAMDLFVRAGIINGSGGSLNPDDVTNRAQMVQVLYKLRGK